MYQIRQIFFPRSTTTEIGYQVKPQSPTLNSRPTSHYTFSQPTSPKSPVNFVQYHQRHRQEYPPIEVEYGFPRTASRSRTRQDRNFRSLDFEVRLREDNVSSYSEAPPYHQYPEEDQWEDRGRGRRRERKHPTANVEADSGTIHEDAPRPSTVAFEARPRRGERTILQPAINLHPYVRTLTSTRSSLQTNLRARRSPLSLPRLVSQLQPNARGRF